MPKVLLETRLKDQICIVTDLEKDSHPGQIGKSFSRVSSLQELLLLGNFRPRPWPNVLRHLPPRCLPTWREKAIESQCCRKSQRFSKNWLQSYHIYIAYIRIHMCIYIYMYYMYIYIYLPSCCLEFTFICWTHRAVTPTLERILAGLSPHAGHG